MEQLKNILLIGLGGFIGSIARYYVSKLNLYWHFFSIPVGTLLVNVAGCLLIGFLTGIADKSTLLPASLRLFLMVGVCGGFTTFSTFANENLMLLHAGEQVSILVYTALSVMLGFLAVYLGYVTSNIL
ncbi:MAG: fluoride efflux transporter CrcB [Bacteroidales bacterium]|nr:fluoride efflux transporter CrcB [Bacteroidales bacterium]